ncbi:MAG: hypothetical protein WC718_02405 [Phycisphaerales bacterium]|jgi:hypothetical protein
MSPATTRTLRRKRFSLLGGFVTLVAAGATLLAPSTLFGARRAPLNVPGAYVVLGTNDLGMHCMQQDFSEFMVLPPYNTLHAQVIRRGAEPDIISSTGDVTVEYSLPTNTHSADKTNFWKHANALFGVNLAPDIGLAGHGLSGTMGPTTNRDWSAIGIPLTPINDDGREDPYPFATINVRSRNNGSVLASTQAVVPVSWEIGCNLCHGSATESVGHSVLAAHDRLHGTTLVNQMPVNCSSCHADPAVGAPGTPGVPYFSIAMHSSHASRLGQIQIDNACYACHPGNRTQCLRDVHSVSGMTCISCHGDMAAVGAPTRVPWVDVPRCGSCHSRPGFEFEQPGKLFRESVGHSGVTCLACHGSPHAIGPAEHTADNLQAQVQQSLTGPIRSCDVCHTVQPSESFFHRRSN